jgi:hypothetical protein
VPFFFRWSGKTGAGSLCGSRSRIAVRLGLVSGGSVSSGSESATTATARADKAGAVDGGNVPLTRSGALCTPLGFASRAIGTTGLPPGTGSPQVPQKASVLSTLPLQLLHFGIESGLSGC